MFTENTSRLKAIKGLKWTKYPDDVLPAFVADMDFESPIAVTNALEEMVRSRDYGYRFNDIDQLISLWVEWVRGQHGLEIAEDECIVFTSSIQALEAAMMMHTGPGDGVALFSPVYHPFASAVEEAGRRLVDIPLRETDWKIDIDRFRDSIDERTRIVLFLNKSCFLLLIINPYFFLPSLAKTYSSLYLMPFPLYGSGFRFSLMLAAI